MPPQPLELIELTSAALRALPPQKTVFFFAVGPLEDHGPHLRLSADVDEATALCRMAAERLERELPGWVGVIAPSLPLGVETNTGALALRVRGHVLRDWLVDCSRSLMRAGFRNFVCFSGHLGPKQLTAIEEAGKIISGKSPWAWFWNRALGRVRADYATGASLVSASSALAGWREFKAHPLWLDPPEHAGLRDTSVGLALDSGRVDPLFAGLPERKREDSAFERYLRHLRARQSGYWGSPAGADPGRGQEILKEQLDEVFPKLRAVWEGANPNSIFRSWYSILPIHKSFFAAWAISFVFFVLLVGWIYLNVRFYLPG